MRIDRVELAYAREKTVGLARRNEAAFGQDAQACDSSDWSGRCRVAEIDLGCLHLRLGAGYAGLRQFMRRHGIIARLLGSEPALEQSRCALRIPLRAVDLRLCFLELRLGAIECGFVGRRIDTKQDVAFLDRRSLDE